MDVKDIDILSKDIIKDYEKFKKLGFIKVPYINKDSGFFMKKLVSSKLINFHLQEEIFYINNNTMYIIKGFKNLLIFSESNNQYMVYLMKIYFEHKVKDYYKKEIERKYKIPLDKINIQKEIEQFILKHNLKVVKKSIKVDLFLKKIRRLKYFLYPRFVAITGVDGSGKSTIVKELHSIMGNNSAIVYMGKKDWQTKIANYAFEKKRFPSIVNILILYFEFWYRYLKTFKNTKVIIFDRYPTEMYLTQTGIRKKVYYLLFNILFPKPSYTFYLYCPVEFSLDRKDDIEDIDEFKIRKKLYDKLYLHNISFDTSKLTKRQVLKNIVKKIKNLTEML